MHRVHPTKGKERVSVGMCVAAVACKYIRKAERGKKIDYRHHAVSARTGSKTPVVPNNTNAPIPLSEIESW